MVTFFSSYFVIIIAWNSLQEFDYLPEFWQIVVSIRIGINVKLCNVNGTTVRARVNNSNSRVISFPLHHCSAFPESTFPPALSLFCVAD